MMKTSFILSLAILATAILTEDSNIKDVYEPNIHNVCICKNSKKAYYVRGSLDCLGDNFEYMQEPSLDKVLPIIGDKSKIEDDYIDGKVTCGAAPNPTPDSEKCKTVKSDLCDLNNQIVLAFYKKHNIKSRRLSVISRCPSHRSLKKIFRKLQLDSKNKDDQALMKLIDERNKKMNLQKQCEKKGVDIKIPKKIPETPKGFLYQQDYEFCTPQSWATFKCSKGTIHVHKRGAYNDGSQPVGDFCKVDHKNDEDFTCPDGCVKTKDRPYCKNAYITDEDTPCKQCGPNPVQMPKKPIKEFCVPKSKATLSCPPDYNYAGWATKHKRWWMGDRCEHKDNRSKRASLPGCDPVPDNFQPVYINGFGIGGACRPCEE